MTGVQQDAVERGGGTGIGFFFFNRRTAYEWARCLSSDVVSFLVGSYGFLSGKTEGMPCWIWSLKVIFYNFLAFSRCKNNRKAGIFSAVIDAFPSSCYTHTDNVCTRFGSNSRVLNGIVR